MCGRFCEERLVARRERKHLFGERDAPKKMRTRSSRVLIFIGTRAWYHGTHADRWLSFASTHFVFRTFVGGEGGILNPLHPVRKLSLEFVGANHGTQAQPSAAP
jgi:hypothetical protein